MFALGKAILELVDEMREVGAAPAIPWMNRTSQLQAKKREAEFMLDLEVTRKRKKIDGWYLFILSY